MIYRKQRAFNAAVVGAVDADAVRLSASLGVV
jgi:hypothetical protein